MSLGLGLRVSGFEVGGLEVQSLGVLFGNKRWGFGVLGAGDLDESWQTRSGLGLRVPFRV